MDRPEGRVTKMSEHTPHTVAGRRSLAEYERSLLTPITPEEMIEALAAVGIDSPDGKAPTCQNVSLAGTRTPSPEPDIDTRCRLTRATNGAHTIRAELDATLAHARHTFDLYKDSWGEVHREWVESGIRTLGDFSIDLGRIERDNRDAATEATND